MRKILLVLAACVAVSCNNKEQNNNSSNTLPQSEVTQEQSETPELIQVGDSNNDVQKKLKKMSVFTGAQVNVDTLLDNFYGENVLEYHLIPKGEKAADLNVVVAKNEFKFMQMLMQHVENTDPANKARYYKGIKQNLVSGLNSGSISVINNKFMKFKNEGQTWYSVWYLSEDKATGVQDYYAIMVPEKEYDYLVYRERLLHKDTQHSIELLIDFKS
ncbi:hypothetical protein [Flammeovirga kamogawensis]|uniref:Lipoprotein n=1 Tax=Flammeovirga kamogawensis TaxID=373891 RepID=A0ABX8H1Z2_9BACT|nr:hypothetical protein [Flammeovirga kamogawensis]MBB6462182.1 co-chaperonin GroES (HSP10) [Flammeovirga kamogawensis]QWG09417.1 hypothetical protein KM029_22685 [Flammeovirga kamogawensis]TRX64935.1 hypothetical protein EO216_20595 [Flammeovirga kamogawensis]